MHSRLVFLVVQLVEPYADNFRFCSTRRLDLAAAAEHTNRCHTSMCGVEIGQGPHAKIDSLRVWPLFCCERVSYLIVCGAWPIGFG